MPGRAGWLLWKCTNLHINFKVQTQNQTDIKKSRTKKSRIRNSRMRNNSERNRCHNHECLKPQSRIVELQTSDGKIRLSLDHSIYCIQKGDDRLRVNRIDSSSNCKVESPHMCLEDSWSCISFKFVSPPMIAHVHSWRADDGSNGGGQSKWR